MPPFAPSDLVAGLRRRLRDTTGTNLVYSTVEMLDALTDAAQEAQGNFWQDATWDSLTLEPYKRTYAIPPYIKRVRKVERQLLAFPTVLTAQLERWQEMHHWQHIPDQQTNQLVFELPLGMNYRAKVYYETDLPVAFFQSTLATSVISTAVTLFYSDTVTPVARWQVPGYLKVGNEIVYYDGVTQTQFTGLKRGMFGTGVATGTANFGLAVQSGTIIEPAFVQEYWPAERFVLSRAMQRLMLMRLQDGDAEGTKTLGSLAAEWDRIATAARQQDSQRHLPRTLRTQRQGRW